VRLVIGRLEESGPQSPSVLVEERFNCQTAQVVVDDQGQSHAASLWTRRKDQQRSTTRFFQGPAADLREDDCPGLLLTDVQLCATELPEDGRRNAILLTTALWNVSTQFESKALHALSIMEQRLLGPQLAADGSRPVAISVAPGPDGGLPVA